jgi:hypothetical protein
MATQRNPRPPSIDPDILLVCGIVAFLAFLGIAAVGFYARTVSAVIVEPHTSQTTGSRI